MTDIDPTPDVIKLLAAADHHFNQDVTSQAATVFTVPGNMVWLVYMAMGTNANRVSTMALAINDGAAIPLVAGIAEQTNMIPVAGFLVLKQGHTLTITDAAFVAADVCTKTIAYWEMMHT